MGKELTLQTDLTSYLKSQASDGEIDSQGDFTISHQNAQKKLAKFSLPRKTAWVCKLVQAAVAWKMQKIMVSQSKFETQFFLPPFDAKLLPTENDVISTLLSGKLGGDAPIEHFCVALRAVVEQASMSFIVTFDDGEVTPKPIFAGEFYTGLTEEERLADHYNRGLGITLTVRHGKAVTVTTKVADILNPKEGIPIISELRQYAYTCPIPINVSGMRVDGLLNSPAMDSGLVPLVFSGLKNLEHSPELLPLPRKFEAKQFSFLTDERRARRTYGGSSEFATVFRLASRPLGDMGPKRIRTRVHWVRDGVIVQTSTINLMTRTLSLDIYINASGLDSDLTGFQLVDNEEKSLREVEILTALSERLLGLRSKVRAFFEKDEDEESENDKAFDNDSIKRSQIKTVIGGSVASVLLTLVNPPLGIFAVGGTLAKASYKTTPFGAKMEKVRECGGSVIDTIRSDLKELAEELKAP